MLILCGAAALYIRYSGYTGLNKKECPHHIYFFITMYINYFVLFFGNFLHLLLFKKFVVSNLIYLNVFERNNQGCNYLIKIIVKYYYNL